MATSTLQGVAWTQRSLATSTAYANKSGTIWMAQEKDVSPTFLCLLLNVDLCMQTLFNSRPHPQGPL